LEGPGEANLHLFNFKESAPILNFFKTLAIGIKRFIWQMQTEIPECAGNSHKKKPQPSCPHSNHSSDKKERKNKEIQ
jgi:hypothetical protein